MDIVTHAGIGLVAASPFLAERPELAVGIVAGSVLPDLDALRRLRDKTAFLRAHQTWSHALPVQLTFSAGAAFIAALLGWRSIEVGMGLVAGFLGHSLLDLTNTYGVADYVDGHIP
jgi:inner membrane protein